MRRCSPTEGSGFRSPRWSPLGRCGGRTAKENTLHSSQEEPVSPDVLVNNVGTLYTFCPLTLRAKEWIDEHVQDDAQWFGHALIVEHRYAWGLAQLTGSRAAGLSSNCDRRRNCRDNLDRHSGFCCHWLWFQQQGFP